MSLSFNVLSTEPDAQIKRHQFIFQIIFEILAKLPLHLLKMQFL